VHFGLRHQYNLLNNIQKNWLRVLGIFRYFRVSKFWPTKTIKNGVSARKFLQLEGQARAIERRGGAFESVNERSRNAASRICRRAISGGGRFPSARAACSMHEIQTKRSQPAPG